MLKGRANMSEAFTEIRIDTNGGETPPGLYQAKTVARGLDGLDAVTDEKIELFREQGYLVVNDAFTQAQVNDAIEGLHDLIDGRDPAFKGIQFEAAAEGRLDTMLPEEKQDFVRKLQGFVPHDARLKAIADDPKLLAVVARIIKDVPELWADQALLKPPRIGREKPWHQDIAFFDLPSTSRVLGVWIALDEAVIENGCMFVIPASHHLGPVVHFKRRDWQICDTDVAVDEAIAVPLKPGGLLFFHGLIHHGTPPTQSPLRRRALQFHYKPVGLERISQEERLAVFGSEGKDVEC
jgi:phytanoyl-CoA hydroxylase